MLRCTKRVLFAKKPVFTSQRSEQEGMSERVSQPDTETVEGIIPYSMFKCQQRMQPACIEDSLSPEYHRPVPVVLPSCISLPCGRAGGAACPTGAVTVR